MIKAAVKDLQELRKTLKETVKGVKEGAIDFKTAQSVTMLTNSFNSNINATIKIAINQDRLKLLEDSIK